MNRNGREPVRIRCVESGAVDKLDNFAAQIALKRGVQKKCVASALLVACSHGVPYLGLHWERVSGGLERMNRVPDAS